MPKLHICEREWDTDVVKDILVDEENDVLGGECNVEPQTIKVSAAQKASEDAIRARLYHEVDHAVIASVSSDHPSDEEDCVKTKTTGWYSIIRNPRNLWFWRRMFAGVYSIKRAPE